MFNRKLLTCGTLGKTYQSDTGPRQVGCLCYMPLKASLQFNCWYYDETEGDMGWPDELNAYPYEREHTGP